MTSLKIATPDVDREVINLSGGTRQKFLVAKLRRPAAQGP